MTSCFLSEYSMGLQKKEERKEGGREEERRGNAGL
jgi:hypothetical protein